MVMVDASFLDVPIPGYGRIALYARYRRIPSAQIKQIRRNASREFKDKGSRTLYAAIDAGIAACIGIFYDHPETGERTQLTYQGKPITGYTRELAEALRFADKVAPEHPERSIVLLMFGGNEFAIAEHGNQFAADQDDVQTPWTW
jgi:hypothetical protein